MPLIGPKEMFKAAYDGHYAIGAFNVNNMEIIQGITSTTARPSKCAKTALTAASLPS